MKSRVSWSCLLYTSITVLKGSVKLLRQGIQDEQTIDRLESYTLRLEQYVEAMSLSLIHIYGRSLQL